MSTSYINAQIGIVDSESNVTVIYPITNASNVSVTPNSNANSANTVQKVVTSLGQAAFQSVETNYSNNTTNAVASAGALYNAVAALSSSISGKANAEHSHSWDAISNKPTEFAPSAHSHTWSGITEKPSAFPPELHNHDDLYYTETEIDALIQNVQNSSNSQSLPVNPIKTSGLGMWLET